ncbi:predicted protein [Fibroporia radiculosa]|nr:predicted protein [Fibroporia radiculosa]
MNASSVT